MTTTKYGIYIDDKHTYNTDVRNFFLIEITSKSKMIIFQAKSDRLQLVDIHN
jgi:hypothetical protein